MTSQPDKKTITVHILPNISRSKSNQTLKTEKYFSLKFMQKMRQGDWFQTSFRFF